MLELGLEELEVGRDGKLAFKGISDLQMSLKLQLHVLHVPGICLVYYYQLQLLCL